MFFEAASSAFAPSLIFFLTMIMPIMLIIEWIIMMIPPRTTIDRDEANGLNKMTIPHIRSIIPSSNHRDQFGTVFLTVTAMLITLTLDKMTQIPSAIAKITDKMFVIATKISPTIIDKIPEAMP